MDNSMRLCSISSVRDTITYVLKRYGVNHEDSVLTAEIMIDGTLRGHKNHGIERIFQIIDGIECGSLNVTPKIDIVSSGPAFANLNANYYIGQPVGHQAMNIAVNLAKETGISYVGVINAGHLGSMSYYSEIASKKGMLGIAMCTTSPAVSLPGGSKALLGTNPISYSFPLREELYTADFSTSSVSRAFLFEADKKGEKIPVGLAVDSNGNMTEDPKEALAGGLLPYGGGIRGALISILVSIMAGPLIGGVINSDVLGTRYMDKSPNKGDAFICIDIEKFTDIDVFKLESASFVDDLLNNSSRLRKSNKGIQKDTDWALTKVEISEEFHKLSISL
ncbi:MAG: Ldh family oxidoreductase [Lachnospiraceae bacterium]|nr:Ldh family oxidoreductase [Lachnospiraceae bacterium]